MKKIKLATTSFRDKTLFKHAQTHCLCLDWLRRALQWAQAESKILQAKLWNLNVSLLHSDHLPQQHILMHCASVTLSDNNCGNDEEQNVVEPCWTLPLRNTTYCLERPCSNTAPASAITSESGNTCRKPSSKDFKVWHSEIQCFNIFQHVSMYVSLAPDGMLRFRVPLCSAGTTGWWWAWVMSKIPWGKVQTWVLEGW